MQKKYRFLFFSYFFITVLILSANFCFAIVLETSYPPSPSGINITANTPVPEYFKYVYEISLIAGFFAVFISLTWAGILYFLSPAKPDLRAIAKDRVAGSISGLLILLLLYLIITTINPALSIFKTTPLQKLPPPPPPPPPAPGVFLYKSADCPAPDPSLNSLSIPDLSKLKLSKQVQSIKILNNSKENTYFLAFLYQNPKFRGECLMINYDAKCKNVKPFASSVDILKYSFTAKGDINIYRNSSFNSEGGWFTIRESDIQNSIQQGRYYELDLNNTKFANSSSGCTVPKDQQDCVKYNKNNECLEYQCPNLGGKNIGSIEIKGNYLVLLVYYNPSDPRNGEEITKNGSWNLCQSFPTIDDVNKDGPRQIKWEDVRNKDSLGLPNLIVVIPVEK